MSDYRQLVAEALAAATVVSRTAHTWFGARSAGLEEDAVAVIGSDSARAYLTYHLHMQLYANFYCTGRARPSLDVPALDTTLGPAPFVEALSRANAGTYAREPGWTVVREEDGAVVVTRDGLSLWVSPSEVHASNGGGLRPGASACVLMPKELLRLSPGFYMALGQAEFPVDGSASMIRFYWNLRSEGAVPLVTSLTERLNAEGLPFRLKVVSDPSLYSRCDAGVLYTLTEAYEPVSRVVAGVYTHLRSSLKPATPALTKALAPGLGLAEDPGGALASFGMHRCQLLAEAIVHAAERGVSDPAGRLEAVAERFAEDGIDLDLPYLNPGSSDRYRFGGE